MNGFRSGEKGAVGLQASADGDADAVVVWQKGIIFDFEKCALAQR